MSDISDIMMSEVNGRVGKIMVGDLTQTINSHSLSIAKLEAQVELIVDIINREEEELQSQQVVNPDEDYMVMRVLLVISKLSPH